MKNNKTSQAIKEVNAPAELQVLPTMAKRTNKELDALIAIGNNASDTLRGAQTAFNASYALIAAPLRAGIASGLFNDQVKSVYDHSYDYVLAGLIKHEVAVLEKAMGAKLSDNDKAGVTARTTRCYASGISTAHKTVDWIFPKSLKAQNTAHAEKEKVRALVNREVEKQAAVIVKKNPALSDKEVKAIKAEIKTELNKKTAAQHAKEKAANDEIIACTKYVEKLAAFSVQMSEVFSAKVSDEQLKMASIIASLRGKIISK